MRITLTLVFMALLAGCGGYQERTTGIEEETTLVIRGEALVGLTVSIDTGFSTVIGEDDLTEFKMGVLGAANSEAEDLQTITLKIDSGQHRVTVSGSGKTHLDKVFHFTHGQTRELRIRQ